MLDYWTPLMGDDLIYFYQLGFDNYTHPDRSTLSFILGHYEGCNARFFDIFASIFIDLLPHAAGSLIIGVAMALFFYSLAINISPGSNSPLTITLTFTVALAILPWWGGMWLRVCHYNYIWSTTLCLIFFHIFFGSRNYTARVHLCLIAILGLLTGAAHEQTGVAMCAAMVPYALIQMHRHSLLKFQKIMVACLIAGTVYILVSPSFWLRTTDDSIRSGVVPMLYSTLPAYIAILPAIAIMFTGKRGRAFLAKLATPKNALMLAAATVAAAVALVGGVPGRTGWFSESIAIILLAKALNLSLPHFHNRYSISIIAACIVLIICHFAVSIVWQRQAYREYNQTIDLFCESTNGIVYQDITTRFEQPPITLCRIKGAPDADDYWMWHNIVRVYGQDKNGVILPTAFEGRIDSCADSLTIGLHTYYHYRPKDVQYTPDSIAYQRWNNIIRIINRAGCGWAASPAVVDPGDFLITSD